MFEQDIHYNTQLRVHTERPPVFSFTGNAQNIEKMNHHQPQRPDTNLKDRCNPAAGSGGQNWTVLNILEHSSGKDRADCS